MTQNRKTPRRTPLYGLHVGLGGRMVDFAGWELPAHYPTGIISEHRHCRNYAALFDVSHMGQVILTGADAAAKLEALTPAALTTLPEGKARYTFFTDEAGGILDDLIVSDAGDHLFVVVNASRRDHDIAHMRARLHGVRVTPLADHALIAIQGPRAEDVVGAVYPAARGLRFMETTPARIMGADCRVSRLGYTGEDGYELSIPAARAEDIARALLAHEECAPAGLGARDSLRLEAGLCLYGNDIDPTTPPVEAGLSWAIPKSRREQGGFPGAARILKQLADGPSRKRVGIRPEGRAPARAGTEIQDEDGTVLGRITSGGFGPTTGGPVAMGYVAASHARAGVRVNLMVRGKALPATITDLPFVRPNHKR